MPTEPEPQRSVLRSVEARTGRSPRVSLREEDSGGAGAPMIDPGTEERLSLPQGRGTYQLMGEIARGGMGVVMRGHDTDLGRDVAMKVLHKDLASRDDVVQRFVEEAQIGGQLQHPGIVPVYELGLMADDRPYFTMKLVKGRTLASLLAERETPAADLRRMLDTFHSVCQTVAYAHSRGVIHRDLKPANIMVGAFGEVQVVDWGLAKVLARGGTADERQQRNARNQMTVLETVRTDGSRSGSNSMVGSVLGTPAYMPPEQASGKVDRLDERSDVFALGAILCEILTGLPPYDGEGERTLIQAAQGEIEPAVSRLDACTADPELVKLAKQCLMPAPAARPRNAALLSERLGEHFESNEERAQAARVEAAEARVHAQEERRARKLTLALAAAVLAIVGLGAGGWFWVDAERTAREDQVAERQRVLAADIGEALNEVSVLRGSERWDEATVAAERARALAEGGDASAELRAQVGAALSGLRELEAQAASRDALARDNEALLSELSEVGLVEWTGRVDANFRETCAEYSATFERHGVVIDEQDPEGTAAALSARGLGSEIALVLDEWAESWRGAREPQRALHLIDVAHAFDPDPVRADLREALANQELEALVWIADDGLEDQPPATHSLLAGSLLRLGDRERALEVYRAAIQVHPSDFSLRFGLARALHGDGDESVGLGGLPEAARNYQAAVALRPDRLAAGFFLARVLDQTDEDQAALELYERVLAARPDDALLLYRTGAAHSTLGHDDEALRFYEDSIDGGGAEWWIAWSHWDTGKILQKRGEHEAGLEHCREAVRLLPGRRAWNSELAVMLDDAGYHEQALAAMLAEAQADPTDTQAQNNVAWYLATTPVLELRDTERALAFARRAVELDPEDGNTWNTLGTVLYRVGELEESLAVLERSVALQGGGTSIDWSVMAMVHHELGHEQAADYWFERSVDWSAEHPLDLEEEMFFEEAAELLGR